MAHAKAPMELVQASVNAEAVNVLHHYASPDEIDPRPLPQLGRENREQLAQVEEVDDGQRVSFRAVVNGVTVTKTFTSRRATITSGWR
jgi:hypothetical protein